MDVKPSVKPRCNECQMIRRKKRVTNICPKEPKHKQRQG